MVRTPLIVILSGSLLLMSCDIVDTNNPDSKYINFKTCDCELIARAEVAKLREQAEIGKNVGRYQMKNEGYRTWRFDTATGRTCVLLAPDWDWKKPDINNQSCEAVDARAAQHPNSIP